MESFIRKHQVEDVKLCDDIVNVFESDPNKEYKCSGQSGGFVQNHVKVSLDEQFSRYNYGRIFDRYVKHLTPLIADYMAEFGMPNLGLQNVQVQKYLPGEGFKKYHFERDVMNPCRTLTFMTYLNDVENAGTEFLLQNITTDAEKGLTVIWPAEFTHPHRGIVSETDIKYIITGWFSFLAPDGETPNAVGEGFPCPESHIYLMPADHDHKYNPPIPQATFVNNRAMDYADGSIYHHPDYDELLKNFKEKEKRSA